MSACDTITGSPSTVAVSSSLGDWTDSGFDVNAGECLLISAAGTTVKFGVNSNQCAYPEGYYSAAADPCSVPSYNPGAVDATFGGDPPTPYVTLLQPAYCLLAKIGTKPSGTHLTGLIRPNRLLMVSAATVGAGGRVWLAINDNIFVDNSGSWSVTLQRYATSPPIPPQITFLAGAVHGTAWTPDSEQAFQGLTISFPDGYLHGVDLATVPGFHALVLTTVNVRGPYRAFLVGTVLIVCNDSGEIADGTALDGVDIFRVGI